MRSHLKPAVLRILYELQSRPNGTKKMSARRVIRAFGYERRSADNVREIQEEFARAGIAISLALHDPPTLDEPVLLQLQRGRDQEGPGDTALAETALPDPGSSAVLAAPGTLAPNDRGDIGAVIAAVKRCTVGVFTGEGSGCGVVVSPDGLIFTCRHVVENVAGLSERRVRVHFADGTEGNACVLRSHRTLGFALLAVPGRQLPAIPLGDPLQLHEAQTVYAVGSHGGLTWNVTRGVVSAVRRTFGTNIEYVQIAAATDVGSSGGPIVTECGDLVGISTYAYRGAPASDAQGSYVALPVDYVRGDIEFVCRLGLEEACRRPYCRHCGWLDEGRYRYCSNCGASHAGDIGEGSVS